MNAKQNAAWGRFTSRVEELGGTVLEDAWLGRDVAHRVRCSNGHECAPMPSNVARGSGLCRICGRQDARTAAEAAFRARVEELGGTVLEDAWLGSGAAHRVRCSNGHECAPRPNSVQQGQGICGRCVPNRTDARWDCFYVVAGGGAVKFGVTSGDPAHRLRRHAADGLAPVRVWSALPGTLAWDLERLLLSLLAARSIAPLRGQEYFPESATPEILRVVLEVLPS
jgi:hypothetical protein